MSNVKSFYKGKNVLVTGCTGFLGKMIVEKLLRTCEPKSIFLLVRSKQGIKAQERIYKMFDEQIFDEVRTQRGKTLYNLLNPIEGDLKLKGLGLTEDDKDIIRNTVHIVFHCGASLNMGAHLGDTVRTNVKGTAEILELMKGALHLEAFILVSTAYSNCTRKNIEERFYDPPIDPELLIRMAEDVKPEVLNDISQSLIGKWPNSYVFTKAVAEHLLRTRGKNMPVALFRPTIITSTVNEPVPGWTDNLYGPLGILLSQHCGILRVVRGNGNIKADTVPGDMVINALLCLAWDVSSKWHRSPSKYEPTVINFSGKDSSLYLSIRHYVDYVADSQHVPFQKAMWYPILFIVNNRVWYTFLKFILHWIPAYILDSVMMLKGQEPKMGKIYTKLERAGSVLHYFLTKEWDISNDNVKDLWQTMSPIDQITFPFDVSATDRTTYFTNILLGLKKYILKEDMSKAKYNSQRLKRLVYIHYFTKYITWMFAAYSIFNKFFLLFMNL